MATCGWDDMLMAHVAHAPVDPEVFGNRNAHAVSQSKNK